MAAPQPRDFSQKAIQKQVVKEGIGHWLTVYPPALGLPLGLAGFLFQVPSLSLVMVGSLVLALTNTIVRIFFMGDRLADQHLARLTARLHEEEQKTLKNLRRDLERCRDLAGVEEYVAQGIEQFDKFRLKYDNVDTLLSRKLDRGELAFARFRGAAEQVYLLGLDNLKSITTILASLSSIDRSYILTRLQAIEQQGNLDEADQKEQSTLRKRLALLEEQLNKINTLLTRNEEAMTLLEETTAAIAAMKTDGRPGTVDFDLAIEQLQRIAQRSHFYNKKF